MRDYWLSNGSLTAKQESRVRLAHQKLLDESFEFIQRLDPTRYKKMGRFFRRGSFGPALSNTSRRLHVALFLSGWKDFSRTKTKDGQMQIVDALIREAGRRRAMAEFMVVLRPILEALDTDDDEVFSDLAMAIRATKQSQANFFLVDYSLVMLGKKGVLTLGELQKILGLAPRTLRAKIKDLRQKYGDWVVPLAPGPRGRPKRK